MTLAPNVSLKLVFLIFKIFGRNDLKIQVDHVWTMRGPSFANVKDKRGTKERTPGPEGYHRPPPPPTPGNLKTFVGHVSLSNPPKELCLSAWIGWSERATH